MKQKKIELVARPGIFYACQILRIKFDVSDLTQQTKWTLDSHVRTYLYVVKD